jgi:hypothetical protein
MAVVLRKGFAFVAFLLTCSAIDAKEFSWVLFFSAGGFSSLFFLAQQLVVLKRQHC